MKSSKKIIAVLLIMMLALTACGGTDGDSDNGDKDPDTDGKNITVALLVSSRGDMSFNDSAIRGVEKADKELDVDVTIIEYGNEPDNYEPSVVDAAESGYDVIITSSSLQDYFEEYAPQYPDTTFILFDSEVDYSTGEFDNVHSIVYSANEGSFLGGYLLANLTETDVLGFLGGMDAPIINDFLLGFVQGALEANPDIKVAVNYVGSWTDSAKGKELTLAMNNQGADMVFNVAGGSGVGAIEAAVDRDFKILGVDSDQAMVYDSTGRTNFAEVIPTSVLKNVDNSLFRAIDLFVKGELKVGETEVLGLKEGGMGVAENKYYDKYVSEEIQEALKDLEEKVKNGEIVVDSVYGKSTEEVKQVIDSVRP